LIQLVVSKFVNSTYHVKFSLSQLVYKLTELECVAST